MANAGRVAIVPKGDYSSSTAYKRLDLVRYNEKAYVAKKANTGVAPTNTEYWMLMTSDGIAIDTALSDTSTNPVQNKVVKTAVDNIQTTSRAMLSTPGWYRVGEFTSSSGSSYECTVTIKTNYGVTYPEYAILRIRNVYTTQEIIPLDVKSEYSGKAISKVRLCFSNENKVYIELYYTQSETTTVLVQLNDLTTPHDTATWKKLDFIPTSETVDGVTVTTTYDIPANASPATSVDLANYLPKSGGKINGNVDMVADDTSTRDFEFGNSAHKLLFRAQTDGLIYIWDRTLSKNVARFNTDGSIEWFGTATGNLPLDGGGTVTAKVDTPIKVNVNNALLNESYIGYLVNGVNQGFIGFKDGEANIYNKGKILHTGNYTDYALPKTGGTVSANANTFFELKNTGGNVVLPQYAGVDGALGFLGFNGANTPVYGNKNGALYSLLHTGNSAKVAIQPVAPTDTSALWVDSTNKVIKAYIDGAWTQIA